jgi:hypothetical protein
MLEERLRLWRHDTQHNDTQHNDIQHSDNQHNTKENTTLSIQMPIVADHH